MRIGVDFDNTIAGYDHVFAVAAVQLGLLPAGFSGGKREVRDAIRLLPEGETAWMELQGQIYGRWMPEARMIAGVADFLKTCRRKGIEVVIVSHKTEFGHFDPSRVNLREAARAWMASNGFFSSDGFALSPAAVHFHATRAEKVSAIATLGCAAFVDDLEEVFLEPGFPDGTDRYLFHPAPGPLPHGPFKAFRAWSEITHDILGPP
jgi:hypothetical protein